MNMRAFTTSAVQQRSALKIDDFLTWGGSMARTRDGKCHLFFSLWPRMKGHKAWVTDSEIGYAVSDDPLGPYEFQLITFRGSGKANGWDRDVTHNPTVIYFDNKFYLYYTGNKGNGEYSSHRYNQRIGVAVAENPQGPWRRFDEPLLDVAGNSWDSLFTTNPSVVQCPDGRFIMVYKAAGNGNIPSTCGSILHGVAFSDSPLGPFKRHPSPIFSSNDIVFPGEDPFVFVFKDKLYTILKDMNKSYTSEYRGLVLFESDNGIDWKLYPKPLVATRTVEWDNGKRQEFDRLERPQLYQGEDGQLILFCAVKPEANKDDSYNIHFELNIEF